MYKFNYVFIPLIHLPLSFNCTSTLYRCLARTHTWVREKTAFILSYSVCVCLYLCVDACQGQPVAQIKPTKTIYGLWEQRAESGVQRVESEESHVCIESICWQSVAPSNGSYKLLYALLQMLLLLWLFSLWSKHKGSCMCVCVCNRNRFSNH